MTNSQFKNQYLGVFYLLKQVSDKVNDDTRIIIREFFGISDKNEKKIISDLVKNNILSKVGDKYCLDKSDKAKKQFLVLLNDKPDLENFYIKLQNNYKKVLLKQILDIEHKNVEVFFKKLVNNLLNFVKEAKTNDDIHINLELLEEYIYRVHNDALGIIKSIINNKNPLKSKSRIVKGWGKIEGKSHNDLIIKCIELLDKIRYLEPKNVFALLIKLSAYQDKSIQSKAKEALKNIAGYNLYVLKRIGYTVITLNSFYLTRLKSGVTEN
jgi:hypothetical protein